MKMLNLAWHSADEFDNDNKLQNIVIIIVACMFLHLLGSEYCKQQD